MSIDVSSLWGAGGSWAFRSEFYFTLIMNSSITLYPTNNLLGSTQQQIMSLSLWKNLRKLLEFNETFCSLYNLALQQIIKQNLKKGQECRTLKFVDALKSEHPWSS